MIRHRLAFETDMDGYRLPAWHRPLARGCRRHPVCSVGGRQKGTTISNSFSFDPIHRNTVQSIQVDSDPTGDEDTGAKGMLYAWRVPHRKPCGAWSSYKSPTLFE